MMTERVTLSVKWFIPEYVVNLGEAVTDKVRQLDLPKWFGTLAPAEWTFPLHMAVGNMLTQLNALDVFSVGRAVAVNVTQGVSELIKGFLTAKNYQKPWKWKNNVRTFVVRPELQKGTSRDSQGREAWHWHVLVWADGSRDSGVLHRKILAQHSGLSKANILTNHRKK